MLHPTLRSLSFAGLLVAPTLAQLSPFTPLAGIPSQAISLDVGDLNGDGLHDLLVAVTPDPQVWALFGQPDGSLAAAQLVVNLEGTSLVGLKGAQLADVDLDGATDVVIRSNSGAYWAANMGSGVLATAEPLTNNQEEASEVVAGVDLNGDGWGDLVIASSTSSTIVRLFQGQGSGGFSSGTVIPLPGNIIGVLDLHEIDWDGDANGDVIVGTRGDFFWVEVDANGATTTTTLGSEDYDYFESGDMDGDGDLDLVAISILTSPPGWIENLGNGQRGSITTVTSTGSLPFTGVTPPVVLDLDGDGDLDFVCVGDLFSQFAWAENLGGGQLGPLIDLQGQAAGTPGLLVALDVDGDGAQDVVSDGGSIPTETTLWSRNLFTLGSAVCTGAPNSSGFDAVLTARGSRIAETNNVTLQLTQAPAGHFAFLLNSMSTVMSTPPGSKGDLCLGGSMGRYDRPGEVRLVDASGTCTFPIDLSDTPRGPGPISILAGQTWYFQTWYRDITMGFSSSLSSAISLTFD